MKQVAIDLGAGTVGGGDGQADTVSINATNGHAITVADNNGVVTVSGLASTVTIANFEEDVDHLVINGQSVTVAAVNSNNTAGTSTASDGSQAAALLGQFMASSFVTAGDGHGRDAACRSTSGPAAVAGAAARLRRHRAPENASEHQPAAHQPIRGSSLS